VVVAIARRAIQANPCQLELVHRHRCGPQVGFDGVPRLVVAQPIQPAPQAIIAELYLTDRVAQQMFQGVGDAVRPVPHGRFAVIGLRQDIGQPTHGQLAIVQPLLQTMRPHVVVEHLSQVQLVGQANDQGNVVDSFVPENACLCHGAQPTAEFAIGPTNSHESRDIYSLKSIMNSTYIFQGLEKFSSYLRNTLKMPMRERGNTDHWAYFGATDAGRRGDGEYQRARALAGGAGTTGTLAPVGSILERAA